MLSTIAIRLLALPLLFTLPTFAHQAVRQEEGQPLFPPNLIATGETVVTGFSIASLPSIPFSASIEAENAVTGADGKTSLQRFRTRLARDSHGRTRIDVDLNPEGAPIEPRLFQTFIYDPLSKAGITLFPSSKQAIRTLYTQTPSSTRPLHSKHPIYVEPSELSGPLNSQPQIEIHREELHAERIDDLPVRHGRQTYNYPAGFPGHKGPFTTVTDYWYSQELQAFVLVRQAGPGNSVHTLRLRNIVRQEPAKSFFAIPRGYRVTQTLPPEWQSNAYCPLP